MNLNSFLGQKAGPYREKASSDRLEKFASSVGAPVEKEAAPTFVTVCRRGEFDLFQKMGVPLSRVLHGEQEYEYLAPIRAGDDLEYETTLAKAFEKRGASGGMLFLVFETHIRAAGRGAAVSRTTVIVRGQK